MFHTEIEAVGNGAKGKISLLENNPLGYFLMAILAGVYIGFGCILMGTVGGLFTAGGSYATRLVNGIVFSVGLCMVTMAGAELFTGNNFVMAIGGLSKAVSWSKVVKLWVVCWIGNLVGSVLIALVFTMTGIPAGSDIGSYLASTAATKMSGSVPALFSKAILCNICVCVAIWCGTKLKSEGAKIAMNFCCVVTFVTCGFEHSVANMTFLTIGLLNPNGAEVSLIGLIYNLVIVTIGNIVGGVVCVALPYWIISGKPQTR
ncbi:MAG: formate/nitrite transporter family protein [Lachnospiraceae bacterium]|nr:formate/nitrite transporter family protein [Lachnospiraceae bacterium]